MMKKSKVLIVAFLLASSCMVQAGWGQGRGKGGGGNTQQVDALSVAEAERLTYLREEEKVAHDVYVGLFARWGIVAFDNISQAEQRHMDAVLSKLNQYGLVDPALTQTGSFTNASLQQLYDNLIAQGKVSALSALMTGALIEEVDMADLDEMIGGTENEGLINLYETLHCGSRNHLRAFVRQIESRGVVYEAQVLTQAAVDLIVDSPMERRCGAGG